MGPDLLGDLDKVDKSQVTFARMLLAAIPMVGGSATVLVDKKIAERQNERLTAYLSDIVSRLESLEEKGFPSDQMIEKGAESSKLSFEAWKPYLFAAIVAGKAVKADEVVRHSLIECVSNLSELEFCTLTSLAVGGPELKIVAEFSELRAVLSKLEAQDAAVVALRNAAFSRLQSYGLINRESKGAATPTQLGMRLLELASE